MNLPVQQGRGFEWCRRNLCSPLETRFVFEMLIHQLAQWQGFSLLEEIVLSEKTKSLKLSSYKMRRCG